MDNKRGIIYENGKVRKMSKKEFNAEMKSVIKRLNKIYPK